MSCLGPASQGVFCYPGPRLRLLPGRAPEGPPPPCALPDPASSSCAPAAAAAPSRQLFAVAVPPPPTTASLIGSHLVSSLLQPIAPGEELLVWYNGEDNPEIAAAIEEERASARSKRSSPKSRRGRNRCRRWARAAPARAHGLKAGRRPWRRGDLFRARPAVPARPAAESRRSGHTRAVCELAPERPRGGKCACGRRVRARPCSRNRARRAAREGRPRLPAPLTAQDPAEERDGKGEPDLGETKMGCTGGRGQ